MRLSSLGGSTGCAGSGESESAGGAGSGASAFTGAVGAGADGAAGTSCAGAHRTKHTDSVKSATARDILILNKMVRSGMRLPLISGSGQEPSGFGKLGTVLFDNRSVGGSFFFEPLAPMRKNGTHTR